MHLIKICFSFKRVNVVIACGYFKRAKCQNPFGFVIQLEKKTAVRFRMYHTIAISLFTLLNLNFRF